MRRILLALTFLLFLDPNAFAQCSPFGNPPQPLIMNEVPLCTGGTVLGPWSDSDGTPRYACLFTPSAASSANPLPLVIFLHPSLVTADSTETSTNFPRVPEHRQCQRRLVEARVHPLGTGRSRYHALLSLAG
jgi:hypothetical protein